MFCLTCGEQDNGQAEYSCKNGHKGSRSNPHKCPEGTKEVRTLASNGYQTSHIGLDSDIKKDSNYHSVNVLEPIMTNCSQCNRRGLLTMLGKETKAQECYYCHYRNESQRT